MRTDIRRTIRTLTLVAFGMMPAAALANDIALATSPAVACLTLPAGAADRPAYPEATLERKEGGVVRVQMEFRGPDRAPRVTLLQASHNRALDDAVTDHVEKYRVPCMDPANGPVTLLREYSFDPDGRSRVMASPTRDSADPARAAQMRCMRHIVPDAKPAYPKSSLRKEEQGVLMVKLHFTAPDQPPTLEWIAATPHRALRDSVEEFSAGLRLPCLTNGPINVMRAYRFTISGGARAVLRDTDMATLLRSARNLSRPAFFDFDTMSCPFDLRLTYARPFWRNQVQQLDNVNPARAPLMNWLAELTLELNEQRQLAAFGNTMIVRVPCGRLDL